MLVNSDLAVTFQPLCTQIIRSDCKGVVGVEGIFRGSQKDLFSIVTGSSAEEVYETLGFGLI